MVALALCLFTLLDYPLACAVEVVALPICDVVSRPANGGAVRNGSQNTYKAHDKPRAVTHNVAQRMPGPIHIYTTHFPTAYQPV